MIGAAGVLKFRMFNVLFTINSTSINSATFPTRPCVEYHIYFSEFNLYLRDRTYYGI